jgi:hypothetical protein
MEAIGDRKSGDSFISESLAERRDQTMRRRMKKIYNRAGLTPKI